MFKKIDYRADIDGLRAIAVTLVVIYHAFPAFLPRGYIGVDVFLVISGYLISKIIISELENNQFSILNFYARRFKRILPAFALVLFFTCIIGVLSFDGHESESFIGNLKASLFFVQNILLMFESGYFDIGAIDKPLLHIWSLSLEEQFYLIWPLLLLYFARKKALFPLILLSFATSLLLNILFVNGLPGLFNRGDNETFYMLYARWWEFAAGALVAWLHFYKEEKIDNFIEKFPLFIPNLIAIISLSIIILASFAVIRDKIQPIFAVFPTALLIAFCKKSAFNRLILSAKPLVFIGLISYPLYLWHWPILSLLHINFGAVEAPILVGAIIAACLCAYLTYQFIEKPLRNTKLSAKNVVAFSLFSLVLCFFILPQTMQFFTQKEPYQQAFEKLRELPAICSYDNKKLNGLNLCLAQDATPHQIAIIGDSHAHDLFTGFNLAKNFPLKKVKLLAHAGCAMYLNIIFSRQDGYCNQAIKNSYHSLTNDTAVETIILSSYAFFKTPAHWSYTSKENYGEALEKTLDFIANLKKNIILVEDPPHVEKNSHHKCKNSLMSRTFFNQNEECTFSLLKHSQLRADYNDILEKAAQKYPNVHFIKTTPLFCDAHKCNYKHGAEVLYRDEHHLTRYGSVFLANYILDIMQKKGLLK
jgi:peptidoglycan/LPS O-acetylase OafA/YrhL